MGDAARTNEKFQTRVVHRSKQKRGCTPQNRRNATNQINCHECPSWLQFNQLSDCRSQTETQMVHRHLVGFVFVVLSLVFCASASLFSPSRVDEASQAVHFGLSKRAGHAQPSSFEVRSLTFSRFMRFR
jgi:hypothetical protein